MLVLAFGPDVAVLPLDAPLRALALERCIFRGCVLGRHGEVDRDPVGVHEAGEDIFLRLSPTSAAYYLDQAVLAYVGVRAIGSVNLLNNTTFLYCPGFCPKGVPGGT